MPGKLMKAVPWVQGNTPTPTPRESIPHSPMVCWNRIAMPDKLVKIFPWAQKNTHTPYPEGIHTPYPEGMLKQDCHAR